MKRIILALLAILVACCMTGCRTDDAADTGSQAAAQMEAAPGLDKELAAIKAKADAIKASLEKEMLTQAEMNLKSKELSDLWEDAMNQLLEAAGKALPEAKMEKLMAEQSAWLAEKNAAVEAAGKEYEGGSMHALIVNSENARRTEERVFQLNELLALPGNWH